MLILDIEVLFPGNEVGYRIGNPTNTDNKSQLEYVTTSNTSTATSYQTSNSNRLIILFCVNCSVLDVYLTRHFIMIE